MSDSPFLAAVLSSAPTSLSSRLRDITSSNSALKIIIDDVLRLCCGKPHSVESNYTSEEWAKSVETLRSRISELGGTPLGQQLHKRGLEDEQDRLDAKKAKTSSAPLSNTPLDNSSSDPPVFTLNSISMTSPVRKKVDITVHQSTLRITSPGKPLESLYPAIPLSILRLAFLLPVPGKRMPYLTVVILPERVSPSDQDVQIIFGADSILTTTQYTTKYPDPQQAHAKGSPSKVLFHSLFAYFPEGEKGLRDLYEPTTIDFSSSSGIPSIDAHIGAKDGHLYFFKHGILWGEKKPCVWFPVEAIYEMTTRSVTGRSFSLFIDTQFSTVSALSSNARRTNQPKEVDEEDELEQTEFSLIEGRDLDAVKRWISAHRNQFVQTEVTRSAPVAPTTSQPAAAPILFSQAALDESDSEDQDFLVSESSDHGSPSSESAGSEDEAGDSEGEDIAQLSSVEDMNDPDELEGNHPLMQPGAMPRMTATAMQEAIGIVKEKFASNYVLPPS